MKLVPHMENYTRCHDCNEPVSNFQVPRGQGGIAILWPKEWDKYIKKLNDGNERIMAVEIQSSNKPTCLINAYLPTKMSNSDQAYQENLDIMQAIIDKYEDTHSIIISGDMNGSLLKERNNSHDIKFKTFTKENMFKLHPHVKEQPTFRHHNGTATSQIDYIIAKDYTVETITFYEEDHLNSSTHIPLKASLNTNLTTAKRKAKASCSASKLIWEKTDQKEFQSILRNKIAKHSQEWRECTSDQKIEKLNTVLHETAELVVPKKLIRLNGYKRKASPRVRYLIRRSKNKHTIWDNAGRPRDGHQLFIDKKDAKKALRKQQRKEIAEDREEFLQKLENNPDQKIFFQLIRRNQSDIKSYLPEQIKKGKKSAETTSDQRELFAEYFQELATPQDEPEFNDQTLINSTERCKLIRTISKSENKRPVLVTLEEIQSAIRKLKNGKSADEYGINAEHVKLAGQEIYKTYQDIFNQIFLEGKVAQSFKTGVITPIPKKSKDPMLTENYRGITVTSIHGKVFEYVLLGKTNITRENQSNMQFGFTAGLSPSMAALIVSEAYTEMAPKEILYITTLDSQKAFDVVNHQILLDKLYNLGVQLEFWDVIEDLYEGLSSTVKWQGETSLGFPINQGVRQGGILSTHLYKQYINELLNDLEKHNMGVSIGNTYAGCPTCADDIVLLSSNNREMQEMLDTVNDYAADHRFKIHPTKSNSIIKTAGRRKTDDLAEKEAKLKIGENNLDFKNETTHLGMTRSSADENKLNVEARITLARRTLYSLIKTGVHGTNGLNPRTSCKIFQTYVLPRLIYGLETLNLQNKDINLLTSFHLNTLKRLQSLPSRTATSAVYLLLGVLPCIAEIHKRQLSLLYSIAMCENSSIKEIALRQLNAGNPSSFFVRIIGTMKMYNLPTYHQIMNGSFEKTEWKYIVKKAINKHWTTTLREDCKNKSTLNMLCIDSLEIGKTHVVWDSISNSVRDVRKATTKARMATGTYMLQTHKAKFNQAEVDPTCPICRLEEENLQHVLTRCPIYNEIRNELLPNIKEIVVRTIGTEKWTTNFNNMNIICQLIIDCQMLTLNGMLPKEVKLVNQIEKATKDYCQAIHLKRLNYMNQS